MRIKKVVLFATCLTVLTVNNRIVCQTSFESICEGLDGSLISTPDGDICEVAGGIIIDQSLLDVFGASCEEAGGSLIDSPYGSLCFIPDEEESTTDSVGEEIDTEISFTTYCTQDLGGSLIETSFGDACVLPEDQGTLYDTTDPSLCEALGGQLSSVTQEGAGTVSFCALISEPPQPEQPTVCEYPVTSGTLRQRTNLIEYQLNQCCSNVESDFAGTWTAIDEMNNRIENISCSGGSGECDATPIDTWGTVITTPGYYCLALDIAGTTGTGITIDADNVTLDLNNHTISGATVNTGIYSLGNSKITIKNGAITGNQYGIRLRATNNSTITNCTLTDNLTGIYLDESHNNQITYCTAYRSRGSGFNLTSSTNNCVQHCTSLCMHISDGVAASFLSSSGNTNLFEHCISDGIFGDILAVGIWLLSIEKNTKIIDCIIDNTKTSESSTSGAVGIRLDDTVESCLIKNNIVCYTSGGSESFGYNSTANPFANLFVGNIAYLNDTNYSGVDAGHIHSGTSTPPSLQHNISLPS